MDFINFLVELLVGVCALLELLLGFGQLLAHEEQFIGERLVVVDELLVAEVVCRRRGRRGHH